MATLSQKTTTSIRIDSGLLEYLKKEAKAVNRSLSNYLETLLFDIKKEQEEEVITPELQAMIDKGRQEIKEGKGTLVSSKQELYDLMESL